MEPIIQESNYWCTSYITMQSLKWKFEFTGTNQILEFILYIYLNKNWKIYWSEHSFTGVGPKDWQCTIRESCTKMSVISHYREVIPFILKSMNKKKLTLKLALKL
jgi:hypothetical protein